MTLHQTWHYPAHLCTVEACRFLLVIQCSNWYNWYNWYPPQKRKKKKLNLTPNFFCSPKKNWSKKLLVPKIKLVIKKNVGPEMICVSGKKIVFGNFIGSGQKSSASKKFGYPKRWMSSRFSMMSTQFQHPVWTRVS